AGERVGRQRRLPPLDDVALVVVMRRLDQEQQKSSTLRDIPHSSSPRNTRPAVAAFWRRRPLPVFGRMHNRERPSAIAASTSAALIRAAWSQGKSKPMP